MLWEVQTNILGDLLDGEYQNLTAQTWFTANWNKTLYNFVCTTNILYDDETYNTTTDSVYNIFASQQDLNAVNASDSNNTIFGDST